MRRPKGLHDAVRIYDSGYRGDCPKEEIEQINSVTWFRWNHPELVSLCFHPVNESKVAPQYRAKLSKMGLQPGIPDWVMLVPAGGYPYAVIELKRTDRAKSRLYEDQWKCLNLAAECGAFAAVAYGAEQFKLAVAEYLQPLYNAKDNRGEDHD